MTPAQEKALAVALDGLREAFGDDERLVYVKATMGDPGYVQAIASAGFALG